MKRELILIVFVILFSSYVFAAKDECILDKDCYNLDYEFSSFMYCENGECILSEVAVAGMCLDNSWCEGDEDCSTEGVCVKKEVVEAEVVVADGGECKIRKDCELSNLDQGFAMSCINGVCVVDEDLLVALELTCSSAVDCEEGTCIEGYCITEVDIETETYGVEAHCLTNSDCEYADDICVESLCQQAKGFPAYIEDGGEKIFIGDKVCVDDSECRFREFCDVGVDIEGKHYCSITPSAAENSVRIASFTDPFADIVDVTRIVMTGNEAKKIELEIKRLNRLQESARKLDVLAVNNKVSKERVENKFKLAEERLQAVEVRINSMKSTLDSSTITSEEKVIIEQNLKILEEKQIGKKLDLDQDLQTAVSKLGSTILDLQQKKLEVKDKIEDSQLSVQELKTKQGVVNKRNEEYLKKLESRKLSSTRSSIVSSSGGSSAPPTSSGATQPSSGGLTPEQIRIIKEKEKRQRAVAAQSSG